MTWWCDVDDVMVRWRWSDALSHHRVIGTTVRWRWFDGDEVMLYRTIVIAPSRHRHRTIAPSTQTRRFDGTTVNYMALPGFHTAQLGRKKDPWLMKSEVFSRALLKAPALAMLIACLTINRKVDINLNLQEETPRHNLIFLISNN